MRGWANYFKHAVARWTFSKLDAFAWWRLVHMLRARHGWSWGQLRRHLVTPDGRWLIAVDGVEYFRMQGVTVSRSAYPGQQDPNAMATREPRLTAETVESRLPRDRHGGFGERLGETDRWQHRHRAPGRLNKAMFDSGVSLARLRTCRNGEYVNGRTGRRSVHHSRAQSLVGTARPRRGRAPTTTSRRATPAPIRVPDAFCRVARSAVRRSPDPPDSSRAVRWPEVRCPPRGR
jgi:hypothetical protein